jgi:hypothetical protein
MESKTDRPWYTVRASVGLFTSLYFGAIVEG